MIMAASGDLEPKSCLSVSNVMSMDVRITTTLGSGQFYNVIGQHHELSVNLKYYTGLKNLYMSNFST